LRASIFTKLGL